MRVDAHFIYILGDRMRQLASFLILILFFFSTTQFVEAAMVTAKRANVRSGPGIENKSLFVYRMNSPLEIVEDQGKWVKVIDFEKDTGWVSKKVIDTGKKGAIVKVANANVRRGPSFKDPVVFIAGYGVAFEVIKSEGAWYQIKHEDGDIGWIQQDLVFSP